MGKYKVIDERTNRVVARNLGLEAANTKRDQLQRASGECMWVYAVRCNETRRGGYVGQCNPTGL